MPAHYLLVTVLQQKAYKAADLKTERAVFLLGTTFA